MKTQSPKLWISLIMMILFTALASIQAQQSLVVTGAVWRYWDTGSLPDPNWAALNYSDSAWPAGPSPLGFGNGGEATTNTPGFITYYYRATFPVSDAASITNLRARLKRDDGAVVYINGSEIFRDNMPAGPVGYSTLAVAPASDDGQTFITHNFPASGLTNGGNLIAVEIHRASAFSTDSGFDLELVGNPLPYIQITSPTNGQTIASSTIVVSGVALPGGASVNSIQLFTNGLNVGQSTDQNFNVTWLNATPGLYTLTASVVDSSGFSATSAPVNIQVEATPVTLLIPRNSSWLYNNKNQDLGGSGWETLGYDDSGWAGPLPGPLGDNLEAGVQRCTSVIDIGPVNARYPAVYYRKHFNVSTASAYQGLILRVQRDDYVVVFLNGVKLTNDGVPEPLTFTYTGGAGQSGAAETNYNEYPVPASALVDGQNVIAVANYQQSAGSSDLQFDLELQGNVDLTPPTVVSTTPNPGDRVAELSFITVEFSEAVTGINASDLLINSEAATNMATLTPLHYTFYFPTPATGVVQVAWAANHGITDAAPLRNPFGGGSWSYSYNTNNVPNGVVISEFMANNANGIKDEDGTRQPWIEIYNPSLIEQNMDGWFLTDSAGNLSKWRFPSVVFQPKSYTIIWASAKDRRDPSRPLHTNFKLATTAGGYLALVDPNTNVVSSFDSYPAQQPNISYGRDTIDTTLIGYFTVPTPGAQNSSEGPGFVDAPVLSVESGVYTNDSLTVSMSTLSGATIRYTTDGSVPTNSSPVYTGPLTFTANTVLKARAYVTGTNFFPSRVVARTYWLLDGSVVMDGQPLRQFKSNLPIMVINTPGTIPDSVPPGLPRAPGSLLIIDTQGGRASLRAVPEYSGLAEYELYGQTSVGFPKKPYRIALQDELRNQISVSLLGLPADDDWKLRNPYSDKCQMNDFLGYELFEAMGNYSCRRVLVDTFVHQGGGKLTAADYNGVEVLFETIKIAAHRENLQKLTPAMTNEPSISGGYIFKKDKDSVGDLNFSTSGGGGFPGQALKYHDPKPRELIGTVAGTNQQNYLVNYLNQMEKVLYANNWLVATGTNHYSFYLDVDKFVDQFWIVEFTKQIDGYRLSDFFSKDRNGKVKPEPIWDWNLSFGNADYLDGGHFTGWYYTELGPADHPWAKRLIVGNSGVSGIGDPDFCQKIADRWSVLRTNVLNNSRLLGRIDQIAALLSEASDRDFARYPRLGTYVWPNPSTPTFDIDYVRPTTYMGIIVEMKKWVNGRYNWIDSLFTTIPAFSQPGGQITNGTVISLRSVPGTTLYYTVDGSDPRAPGGGVSSSAISYSGPITLNGNMVVIARARTPAGAWQNSWSGPAKEGFFTTVSGLRITEIMYHPTGTGKAADKFEYIEVQNITGTPLNLSGFQLDGIVSFQFPNLVLAPGQFGVIVSDVPSFQARYGISALILGTFAGQLANSTGQLILTGPEQETIHNFSYVDRWYRATDGPGFSLVIRDPYGPLSNWNSAAGWRASTAINGSAGAADPTPPELPPILVNEARTADPSAVDAIELYNPTTNAVNIGGWFLSDKLNKPAKFAIPPGTTIAAGGFLTFTEADFNANTNNPNSFALSANGDGVYLSSGNGVQITGWIHGFDFGASEFGITFGRYVNSQGDEQFVAQSANTIGASNAGPKVGPVVISEINYHPVDLLVGTNGLDNTTDEFIELQNISGSTAQLYDSTNVWRLRGEIDYAFPPLTAIPAGGFILLVGFDPLDTNALAGFRSRMGVPDSLPIYGPWRGQCANSSGTIELHKPHPNDTNEVLVEQIQFSNSAPWPTAADGLGLTLQRVVAGSFANDPTNWVAAAPSPGTPATGGTPPVITSQPGPQTVIAGTDFTMNVTASGSSLRYQWRFQGEPIAGGTNATLVVTNFQLNNAGLYNFVVYNGGGVTFGSNFLIHCRIPLKIIGQPVNATNVVLGVTTNFTIFAVGQSTDPAFSAPLRYQWYFNSVPIGNGTDATLTITNVQFTSEGNYYCVLHDAYNDTVTSDIVRLTPVAKPWIILQPLSLAAVEGGNAWFSIVCTGSVPMSIRWRASTNFGIANFLTNVPVISGLTNSVLMFTNLPFFTNTLRITAVITNAGGQSPLSAVAVLSVLKDTDHDGLPDIWEASHSGFNTNNPVDALRDDDGDGMSNAAEYIAGTDYRDANSYLKVQIIRPGLGRIQFTAVTNRTYTVQYKDSLDASTTWKKLADIFARNVTRTETVLDPNATTNRFYRLVIPIQP